VSRIEASRCQSSALYDYRNENDQPGSQKLEGGQGRSPSPKLESDPRVLRYRYDANQHRYQVTRYDPERVSFTRDGRPLIGATVQLDGQTMRADDAAHALRGRARSEINALRAIERTPYGTSYLLSSPFCKPVTITLEASIRHCDRAEPLLRAGKGKEAEAALALAARAHNEGVKLLRTARATIDEGVKATVTGLKLVKFLGEVAEVILVATGAGAVAKGASAAVRSAKGASWLATAAWVATTASIKTAHRATLDLRNGLCFAPDERVDWRAIGKSAAWNLLTNAASAAVSDRIETALEKSGAETGTIGKAARRVAGKLAVVVAKEAVELAHACKVRASANQMVGTALARKQPEIKKLLREAGLDVGAGLGKAVFEALLKAALGDKGLGDVTL
jgi:hypothetical protein